MTTGGVIFLLLAIAGGYAVWTFLPIYAENFQLKTVLREAANRAYTEKNDERLRSFIFDRIDQISKDGGIAPRKDQVAIQRTAGSPPEIDIRVTYVRTVRLKGLDKVVQVPFETHVHETLEPVTW